MPNMPHITNTDTRMTAFYKPVKKQTDLSQILEIASSSLTSAEKRQVLQAIMLRKEAERLDVLYNQNLQLQERLTEEKQLEEGESQADTDSNGSVDTVTISEEALKKSEAEQGKN